MFSHTETGQTFNYLLRSSVPQMAVPIRPDALLSRRQYTIRIQSVLLGQKLGQNGRFSCSMDGVVGRTLIFSKKRL